MSFKKLNATVIYLAISLMSLP